MTQNILITGGSGFIGSNLVDFLVLKGHKIFVVDDLSTGLKENENIKATYFYYDLINCIKDTKYIKNILNKNKITTVYHLAANADISLSINNPEKVYGINLVSSIALVNACNNSSVNKFIFASSAAIYGDPEYLPVDEKHPAKPISPYGLTKLGFEQYLDYFKSQTNILFTIYRFPNIYGYRQRPDLEGGVIAIFADAIQKNKDIKIFGDGEQTRDWVEVSDIITALYKNLEYNEKYKIFCLGSSTKTSLNTLFNYFKELTGYSKTPKYLDEKDGDIKHMVMSYEYAKEELDWEPTTSLKDGLKKLINFD